MTDINSDDECHESFRECIESKRRLVRAAIAANPTASSRELAKDLPVSDKLVGRVRKSGTAAIVAPTTPTKKARAAEILAQDPSVSNVAIAAMAGCTEKTVRDVRKSLAESNVIKMSAKLRQAGVTAYPTSYPPEIMEWIDTYQQWPRATKRQAREAFFATINGVTINGT